MTYLMSLAMCAAMLVTTGFASAEDTNNDWKVPEVTLAIGTYKVEVYRTSTYDVNSYLFSVKVPELGKLAATSTTLPDALAELGNMLLGLKVGELSSDEALTPAVRQMLTPNFASGTVSRMDFKQTGPQSRTYTLTLGESGDRKFVVEDWMLPPTDSEEFDPEYPNAPKVGKYVYITFVNSANKGTSLALELSYDMPTSE